MALDMVGPVLESALAIAYDALDPKPDRYCLYSGEEVAWDACECGQLWVRLILVEPWKGDGNQQRMTTYSPCGVLKWSVTLGIGVLRCAATMGDNGEPPPPAVLTAETLQMTQDMGDLSRAIACEFPKLRGLDRWQVERWDPLGPETCVGGEWTVSALVDVCKCED